ncbi:hypothetical protein T05_496 [Trichinella murrelli]|uniref:Uncharacterized protein n=1 Tax=Trichinella murrelli TaxID=144512 RepID=A0A0V0U829_9BILA|nr:hypothetical protein T05_496 [Trichinella murrelli]
MLRCILDALTVFHFPHSMHALLGICYRHNKILFLIFYCKEEKRQKLKESMEAETFLLFFAINEIQMLSQKAIN